MNHKVHKEHKEQKKFKTLFLFVFFVPFVVQLFTEADGIRTRNHRIDSPEL